MKLSGYSKRERPLLLRASRRGVIELSAAAILTLGMAAGAQAQFASPQKPSDQQPPAPGGFVRRLLPPPGPMGGVFSFVEPLSDVNPKVVKDAPFSAVVVRETVQQLADGNRIDRKSTGKFARDSHGRTRRQMTLENIGPWAAAGRAPELVFINDPVSGKVYTLDESKKTAYEMSPPPKLRYAPGEGNRPPRGRRWARSGREFKGETDVLSLGEKTMDGVKVEGTRIVRRIPAGRIGNEKPIVITTERWYSPELETTILLKRTDPRFGVTIFRLTNIKLADPPESLFAVPSGYAVKTRPAFRGRGDRHRGGRPPDFP